MLDFHFLNEFQQIHVPQIFHVWLHTIKSGKPQYNQGESSSKAAYDLI